MADPVRTEDGAEARTGGGTVDPLAVEPLTDLAAEARALDQREQASAAAVVQRQEDAERAEQRAAEAEAAAAAQELADVLVMGRDMAADLLESAGKLPVGQLAEIWSEDKLVKVSGALLMVLERHGAGVAQLLERWGPHVALAVAVMPPTVATVKAIKANATARPIEAAT